MKRRYARGLNLQNVLVVGAGEMGRAGAQEILVYKDLGFRLKGFLEDDRPVGEKVEIDGRGEVLGRLEDLGPILEKGEIRNGFVLVRPPGHHSMRVVHGNRGFCNINNMAIMVDYLRSKYGHKKIAVIDTDVHHGDGTQEIFWHDPDVLCLSFHQDGHTLYPGSGFVNESMSCARRCSCSRGRPT